MGSLKVTLSTQQWFNVSFAASECDEVKGHASQITIADQGNRMAPHWIQRIALNELAKHSESGLTLSLESKLFLESSISERRLRQSRRRQHQPSSLVIHHIVRKSNERGLSVLIHVPAKHEHSSAVRHKIWKPRYRISDDIRINRFRDRPFPMNRFLSE
jgi:hypothetical protein